MTNQDKLQSFFSSTLKLSKRMLQVVTKCIIEKSTLAFKNLNLRSEVSKITDLCKNNKEVCVGASIVLLTILLEMRKTKNQKKEGEAEKQIGPHEQQTTWLQRNSTKNSNLYPNIKFMDEEGLQSVDEPSTATKPMRNMMKSKRDVVFDELSSDDEEREDKLFFEMFNSYRKTEEREE